jgi:L-lactate dehydrogenase
VNPQSVHAYILGEHGDSSFPVYAYATVGGRKLLEFPEMTEKHVAEAFQRARNAAYEIIKAKGATYYAIAVVARKIMETIFSDAKTVLPLSYPLDNYYGHSGVSLSVPCILSANGVERVVDIEMSDLEQQGLAHSVESLKPYCEKM